LILAVNGAGYTSKTTVYYTDFIGGNPANHTSSQTFTYGTPYILTIIVTKSDGTSCTASLTYPITNPTFPCPTGTITLTGTGAPFVAQLNNFGFAEDQPISLSPGTYSITATYSGDANYSAGGPSNTLSITVNKANTSTSVQSSLNPVTSGTPVTLQATISSSSNSVPPTGTVQFVNGSTNIGAPVTCTAVAATATTGAGCTATLPTTISMSPPPSGPRTPTIPVLPILAAFVSLLLFALGLRYMPQPRRRAYAYAGLVAFALLALGIAGCSSSGSGGGGGHSKTVTISAIYSGDTNYSSSTGTTAITVQ
jgi:hypothetical protein